MAGAAALAAASICRSGRPRAVRLLSAAPWAPLRGGPQGRLRAFSAEATPEAAPEAAAVEASPAPGEDAGGGLFGDVWWPTVADRVHRRLAQRPQGLPEDPLAQGVLSWVEYELARKTPRDTKRIAQGDEAPEPERETSCQDEHPTPLPANGDWRWLLRGSGEIVGPKGDYRS
mmetsp:Transcript_136968/g.425559  ORF Transcript_136968/g.425559 Transcript_136968/m.425559 type:complete len:173 (-) Transcript_136968:104-622(-)